MKTNDGMTTATLERRWRIRISDCYCEYEYELNARANDVSIYDLYELVRERLKANDVHGRFVDPEENSPRTQENPYENCDSRKLTEHAGATGCGRSSSTDWFAALEHLKKKRSEITHQIEVVERERERCRRTERKESMALIWERRRKVAQMVLRDGMSIKDAGKAIGVGQVCARKLLHRWCDHANHELYKSDYHHNEYDGGWSNDCPPSLNWLRDHAEDFAANGGDEQRAGSAATPKEKNTL